MMFPCLEEGRTVAIHFHGEKRVNEVPTEQDMLMSY